MKIIISQNDGTVVSVMAVNESCLTSQGDVLGRLISQAFHRNRIWECDLCGEWLPAQSLQDVEVDGEPLMACPACHQKHQTTVPTQIPAVA